MIPLAIEISPALWIATIAFILGLLAFDFIFHVRKAHIPSMREAGTWWGIYVSIAILFGVGVWLFGDHQSGMAYFQSWITEQALSIDNLFVFLIIMASFKVPRADQQKVLLFGIVFAMIARGGFIALGSALISRFAWIFYIFGIILLITAGNMLKEEDSEGEQADNFAIRLAKRFLHTTDYYDGDKLFTIHNGKKAMTPMLLVMIAIGGTDLLFALDSVPAIFAFTTDPYILFTATAFSLMGLRQLFFLIDGLLDRLIYLKYGLCAILALIGVKLILHALHENNVPFINDGNPVAVVEIPDMVSLGSIVGVLLITVIASISSPKGKALTAVNNARRYATEFLDDTYKSDDASMEETYARLLKEMATISLLPKKHLEKIRGEKDLMTLFAAARERHDQRVADGQATFFPGLEIGRKESATQLLRAKVEPGADVID